MPGREPSGAEEQIVGDLDRVLPGNIDRRKFLRGSLGAIGATMLAGCSGDAGGGGTVFTAPWKQEPSWGAIHVAEGKGYWEDEGVSDIDGREGNGSDTESQQIGIGNKEMGITDLSTAISVIPATQDTEQLDMKMVAMARSRPLLSLIWRTDEVEDETDIAGKDVLAASGFAATTWDIYPDLVGVDPSKVNIEEGTEEVAAARLANNDVQAVWGSIDLLPAYEAEVDVELGVEPLTGFGPFYGNPIWVNGEWYDNKDDNVEYMSNVITGYFKALKWSLLNQEEYLDYLQNEVNTNLQTWTEDELVGQHSILAAQAVSLEVKEEGLGYFTGDGVQFSLDNLGPGLVDDPDTLPSADELHDLEPWEESEKVTFSDDEWNQLSETAGEYWSLFEEAEKDN
ncbi:ABC transporter substrate-binding protein [Natronorubrum halophilum]|uniref:ABC transporter substrate-binding protein n=1 Tax=Natronorubrum halophilum TaxID=1702106 RepID=UPI000EF6948F|nr:ABC transporter substrate-binding protein [Natronorubrum halophilum]